MALNHLISHMFSKCQIKSHYGLTLCQAILTFDLLWHVPQFYAAIVLCGEYCHASISVGNNNGIILFMQHVMLYINIIISWHDHYMYTISRYVIQQPNSAQTCQHSYMPSKHQYAIFKPCILYPCLWTSDIYHILVVKILC